MSAEESRNVLYLTEFQGQMARFRTKDLPTTISHKICLLQDQYLNTLFFDGRNVTDKSEQGLLGLINNFRDEMGFSPLTWDEELYDIAAQINSSVDKESNDLMTKTPRFPGRSLHILRDVVSVREVNSKEKLLSRWFRNKKHANLLLSSCTSSAIAADRVGELLKITQVIMQPITSKPAEGWLRSRKRKMILPDKRLKKRKMIEYDNLLMVEREILSQDNSKRNERLTSLYDEKMSFLGYLIEKRIEEYRQSHHLKALKADEQLTRVSRFYSACVLDDIRDLNGKQFSPSYIEIAMSRSQVNRIGYESFADILFNELELLGFVKHSFRYVTHYGVGVEGNDERFVATVSINDQNFNEKRRAQRSKMVTLL